MKLEKLEGHENYVATIIKLPAKQKVEGLDKLVKVTVFGNDVLTQKDTDENQLYIFFPAECVINAEYLSKNNEFRHTHLNSNPGARPGFFEDSGRVKSLKFKGVISTGYIAPLGTLVFALEDINISKLKEGDEFNSINGHVLCKKYKVIRQQATTTKESRFNKKLKRFNKLVPNQFRFHESTSHLAKNLHQFNPEDIIVITSKWHGTSAVFSNVLIKKELPLKERVVRWFGVSVVDTKYDNLYSSRSVIKNQYINKEATVGYYNEDIWGVVNKELEGKIEQGITIYGEIVGYLESGKMIQKNYDYGCNQGGGLIRTQKFPDKNPEYFTHHKPEDLKYPAYLNTMSKPEHKFLVYRITYTKPDGNVIEFSWQQIKDYCKKHNLETVKELYFGKTMELVQDIALHFHENLLRNLQDTFLEKDCIHCINKVPAEGIVVRLDGRQTYQAYKLKSKRFLLHESKQLDDNQVDIESIS